MALRTSTYLLLLLGLALVILVLGGLGIWFQGSTIVPGPPAQPGPAVPPVEPLAIPTPPSPSTSVGPPSEPPATRAVPQPSAAPALPPATAVPAEPVADFDLQLDTLFASGLDDSQIAQRVLSMMPRLAASNQVQAAAVLIDLVPDEQYASLAPILTNALSNADVLDLLMGDLLGRPDATQLPLLWEMARTPDHPRRIEAKDYLELFLEADHGTDWGQWARAIQKYLSENPP